MQLNLKELTKQVKNTQRYSNEDYKKHSNPTVLRSSDYAKIEGLPGLWNLLLLKRIAKYAPIVQADYLPDHNSGPVHRTLLHSYSIGYTNYQGPALRLSHGATTWTLYPLEG